MAKRQPVVVWFRQDLRLADNPALSAAVKSGAPVLPVYILDDSSAGQWAMGAASRWWLHQSLAALDDSLDGNLKFLQGRADESLPGLIEKSGASTVYWNRCFEPWRVQRDRRIMQQLRDDGISVRSHSSALLFQPQSISKDDGTPYRVFTPFYKKCIDSDEAPDGKPLPAPETIEFAGFDGGDSLDSLDLIPDIPWYKPIAKAWSPGEAGASDRLENFLDEGIQHYKEGRNRPDRQFVSRLSPHLHFGEISPAQVWHATKPLLGKSYADDVEHFRRELGWREFSYHLLYHWPEISTDNLQKKFDRFPWRDDPEVLECWQRGRTGYPIVDAGMRELWQTGYMHNRVRMIVASFLVKNLLLHWHHGEQWFWDTLVDADLANNSASWQWVAGSGADAAPYFRIFNPVTQGNKFDPDGDYVRRYVPEIAELPTKFIHSPWEAPDEVLQDAGLTLGKDYPQPIVDLKASRERALSAFKEISG